MLWSKVEGLCVLFRVQVVLDSIVVVDVFLAGEMSHKNGAALAA